MRLFVTYKNNNNKNNNEKVTENSGNFVCPAPTLMPICNNCLVADLDTSFSKNTLQLETWT